MGRSALRTAAVAALAPLLFTLFLTPASWAADTHRSLNWSAPYRWVHFDNTDSSKTHTFEQARIEWLKSLRQGDSLLADGRPILWQSRSGPIQTFLTFYPFTRWADLDARSETVRKTNAVVGSAALERYDAGDVALVAPHYTQIWRHLPDADFVAPGVDSLSEITAGFGRIEVLEEDLQRDSRVDTLWAAMRAALRSQGYPLVCRFYVSSIGSGELIRMWLAPDAESLRRAPSIRDAVIRALGATEGRALCDELARLLTTRRVYVVERRLDLSNLGR